MSSNIGIKIQNMTMQFDVSHEPGLSLNFLRKKYKVKKRRVTALKDINIEINQGENVGLLGLNGAGKSTLLKLMSKIYRPTKGKVIVNGHICPLFELATGFEMDMTGWENIRIRALLLGMRKKEIDKHIQAIADFTELGEFLDLPVRTYSSGMFIRLAFATSTAINPEILLLDEVVGAGDIKFEKKARERMLDFINKGKILVFTSHSMDLIKNYCQRVIWLEDSQVKMDGNVDEVVEAYTSAQGQAMKARKREVNPYKSHGISLRLLTKEDLEHTLEWYNHQNQWLNNKNTIDQHNHFNWFEKYQHKADDYVFIFEDENQNRLGQLAIYNIDWEKNQGEFGRFIVNPDYMDYELMKRACNAMLELSKSEFKLSSLLLEVKKDNEKAIHFYQDNGFLVETDNNDNLCMRYTSTEI